MNTMTKFVRAPVIAEHFGKSTSWARRLGKDAGAEVKYGKTSMFDTERIGKYLEEKEKEEE